MGSGTKTLLSLLAVFFSVWLISHFLLPLLSPFLLGTLLALAAEPMVGFLNKKLHVPRGISAGIGVGMAFCFLAMVFLLVCAFFVRELSNLSGVLPYLEETAHSGVTLLQNWLLNLTNHTPQSIQPMLRENISALFSDGAALINKGLQMLLGLAGNLLSHIPDSALSLGTAIISGFMISAKLPRIRRWILRRFPKEKLRPFFNTVKRVKTAMLGWAAAQLKLMAMTMMILMLGFTILRIPYAPVWAAGIALVDALPVLGTGTILMPWALVCFLQQDTGRAIGLLGTYGVVTLTRSILEPRLLGHHLGLDPLVTLIALYVGYKLWGIPGMIFAPILAVAVIQILPEHDRRRQL